MRVSPFAIRAIAITVAVGVLTGLVGSAVVSSIRHRIENSQIGRIDRAIKAITPDVERRDKEVEDLTRP
jgi:hypothetical protein